MLHSGLMRKFIGNTEVNRDTAAKDIEDDGGLVRKATEEGEPQAGPSNQEDDNRRSTGQNTPLANGWSTAELQMLQLEDPDICPILQAILAEEKPSSKEMVCKSPACRHYWILRSLLTVRQRLLFNKFVRKDGTGDYQQFIVPRALKKDIMLQMHDSVISGHLGCKKTKRKRSKGSIGTPLRRTLLSLSATVMHVGQTSSLWLPQRPL